MSHNMMTYYTFSNEFGTKLKANSCLKFAKELIASHDREQIIRFFSSIAIEFGPSNSATNVVKIQNKFLGIPVNAPVILIHRLATLTIFQLIYSIKADDFGIKEIIPPKTTFLLYLLVNEFLQAIEMKGSNLSTAESLFFSNIKYIQFTQNNDDIKAGFYLYREYYKKMKAVNETKYSNIIQKEIGFTLDDYIKIIDAVEKINYQHIFNLFDKYAVIHFDDIEREWNRRKPRLDIPFNTPFLQKYPLIKKGDDFFLTDSYNLITSVFKNLYEFLLENDRQDFKGKFGKEIVEPVIKELLEKTFVDDKCKILKVGTKKFEYADSGILVNDNIFLFEIKSTVLNNNTIYEPEISKFYHHFDNKFIVAEGVNQQIGKLKRIDDNFKDFCSLSGIDSSKKYKLYPILVCFEEAIQSFCCNWYISDKFKRMSSHLNLQNIKLATCHSTITFNEVFRMQHIEKEPSEKLELLKLYSDTENKKPHSFGFFLQDLNVFQEFSKKRKGRKGK